MKTSASPRKKSSPKLVLVTTSIPSQKQKDVKKNAGFPKNAKRKTAVKEPEMIKAMPKKAKTVKGHSKPTEQVVVDVFMQQNDFPISLPSDETAGASSLSTPRSPKRKSRKLSSQKQPVGTRRKKARRSASHLKSDHAYYRDEEGLGIEFEDVFFDEEILSLEKFDRILPRKSKSSIKTVSVHVKKDKEDSFPVDRRVQDRRVADQEVLNIKRREKVQRRRQIDPTTCERDYTADELEFMNALDEYKRNSGRMFPTCSEILEVLLSLGYIKPAPSTIASVETITAENLELSSSSPLLDNSDIPVMQEQSCKGQKQTEPVPVFFPKEGMVDPFTSQPVGLFQASIIV